MEKMRLMSLLASLFLLLGFTIASAQTNTFTRSVCNPNFQGCSNISLTLRLETQNPPPQFNLSTSKSVNAPSSVTFGTSFTKIKVSLAGYSSTHYYSLPTTIGESIIISLGANGEGVGPYTVGIYKSGNNQFIVSVGYMAY